MSKSRCPRCDGYGQVEVVAPPTERSAGIPYAVCCDCAEGQALYSLRADAAMVDPRRPRPHSVREFLAGGWVIRPGPRDLVPLAEAQAWDAPDRHRPDRDSIAAMLGIQSSAASPPRDSRWTPE